MWPWWGVAGRTVEVEADVGNGLAGIHLIGLPDTALSEARDRVRSAMVNSHYPWPDARIIVSLFPASLPKRGSQFDLAIAVAILGAAGVVPAERIAEPFFLGGSWGSTAASEAYAACSPPSSGRPGMAMSRSWSRRRTRRRPSSYLT
ncbi:hypothetical protein GCM10020001_067960 [Nonomuraea salmonea]